jgi:hypothetical protein
MTAREHSEQLAKDPTFATQRLETELKRLREVEANRRVISGLVVDLARVGFPVDSVAEPSRNPLCVYYSSPDGMTSETRSVCQRRRCTCFIGEMRKAGGCAVAH